MTPARAERVAGSVASGSVAGSLVFQLWLFAFIAFVGTTLLFTHPVLRAGAQLAYAVPVFAWALLRVRGPMHLLDVAIIAGIAAHLVVSFTSLDPQGSLEASGIVVTYAATFWLARHVDARPRLRRVGVVAAVLAIMFWLVILAITWSVEKVVDVGAFGWPPRLDAHQPYVWGSVNTPPVLVLLVAPFIAWLPPTPFRRAMIVLWVVAAAIIVPFSVGRAAWVGMAVALVAAELLSGFPIGRRVLAAVRRGVVAARASVAVVGLLAIGLLAVIVSRSDSVFAVIDSRIRLWQQGIGLFAADPLTGSGPSTFPWARLIQVPDFVDRVGARAAHNVPVQTLADGGIVLGIAMVAIAIAWVALIADRRERLDARRRLAAAAVIGYAGMGLFDDLSFLPAVTAMVVILAAWAIPPPLKPSPVRGRIVGARGLLLPAVLALTAAVALPGVVWINAARIEAEAARTAAFDEDWERSLAGFRRAVELQPSNALHWTGVGLFEHRLGRDGAAREAYLAARDLSPGDPRPWGALAALTDDPAEERALLLEAARRSNTPQFAYRLAEAHLAAGNREDGARFLAIAVVIRPALFAAVPEDLRAEVRDALPDGVATVGSIAGRDPNEALWNAALAFGEVHPGAPLPWQAMERLASGALDDAQRLVDEAIRTTSRDPRAHQAASALARARCDRGAYEQAESALDRLGRESPEATHGIVERPGLYLEQELGDYQPLDGPSVPATPQWPNGLVEVPDCGW